MSQYRIARILHACCTYQRAMRASQRCLQLGRGDLSDVLWYQAHYIRSVGYPLARETYLTERNASIGRMVEASV